MRNFRKIYYLLIILWILLCTLTSCSFLHSQEKKVANTATVSSIIPLRTKPTTTITPNLSANANTGAIPNAGDSFTQMPILKVLTATPQISSTVTETPKRLIATPTQSSIKTNPISTLHTPTPSPTLLETAPPGWIAFSGLGGDFTGINIIHTSGRGWRNIKKSYYPPQSISWSPDGQWIAAMESKGDIAIVRPDGSEFIQLTHPKENETHWAPSWSPNSQIIIYTQTTHYSDDHYDVDLYTIDINTRIIRQLTNTPGVSEQYATWSPRGDKIAYLAFGEGGISGPQLMIMNTDGSNKHSLMTDKIATGKFDWFPDGNSIIFSSGEKCKDLYQINLDGSGLKNLTNYPGDDYSPTLSSTGDWLAFGYSFCDQGIGGMVGTQVYLMRLDGQGLTQLTNKPDVWAIDPSWDPIPGLEIGKTFAVTELGDNLKLRASASLTGTVQIKIPEGEKILVLEGPAEADEYLWWRVRVVSNEQEGWVAENPGWFIPVSPTVSITPTPTP
jgi:Tol biopolymer transport system component